MSEHLCVVCPQLRPGEPRIYDRPHVCEGCRTRLATLLSEVAEHYAHLREHLAPGSGSGERVSGTREAPLPLRVDTLDLMGPALFTRVHDDHGDQIGHQSVATVLDSWARDWNTDRGEYLPDPSVPELVEWLGNRLEWACDNHAAVDDFAAELTALNYVLRSMTGTTRDRRVEPCKGVPCRRCDLLTLAHLTDGSGEVECQNPDCRLLYRADDYRRWCRLVAAAVPTPA